MSRAFSAALDRDGGPVVGAVAAAAMLALLVGLVWWVLRERRREQREQRALDARHETAMSAASTGRQRREWVRVARRLAMTVRHVQDGQGAWYEECETHNVSGGGVAFFSRTPPPPGAPLDFTLDLGEETPLSLQGVVARIEPSTPGKPALVALKIEPCPPGLRERIVRWVARAEKRELLQIRRGRLCASCGRPLADGAREEHSTCASPRLSTI